MDNIIELKDREMEWWETFDGVLSKLEELRKENLQLKEELLILKKRKRRKKKNESEAT